MHKIFFSMFLQNVIKCFQYWPVEWPSGLRHCTQNQKAVTYSGRLVWAPKKHFSGFLFSVVFQHVVNSSSDQQFHNPSNYSNGLEYKNADRRVKWRQRLKQKKKLSMKNLFIHLTVITDDASIRFFFYVNSFHCFIWFLLYYLLHLLSSDHFAALMIL